MNSMSLLRNSVIVGGATFLVGSALMEVSKGDEKVGWWPYAATFLSGAMGFYLLKQQTVPVPEALELDAEYDFQNQAVTTVIADEEDEAYEELAVSDLADEDWEIIDIREAESALTLQAFASEVFMADRKIRRRTRWTWTRGPEDGFTDKDTVPYSEIFSRTSRKGRGWRSTYVDSYKIEDGYHINDLPEGYHLHLFKPTLRKDNWKAYAKSPKSDTWDSFSTINKSALTADLLDWYNKDIAQPKQKALTPIDKLKIAKGLKSGKIQIERVVIPAVYDGDRLLTNEEIQYFVLGGPNQIPPTLFANFVGGRVYFPNPSVIETYGVYPFCQGLMFMGVENVGTLRSVNRYNKDSQQWVKSYPAWFQNAVRNKLTGVTVSIPGKRTKYGANMEINDITVLRFFNGAKEYSWDTSNRYGNTELREIDTQYGKQFQFEILDPEGSGEFITPRPSTQRKIYDESFKQDLNGDWQFSKAKFKMAVIARYQYERKNEEIQDSMQQGSISSLSPQSIGELMLRRFKKN